MYENITDDITTSTTKLAIVPTPIVKSDAVVNSSVTESITDSMEQNNQTMIGNSSMNLLPEKSSRKKEIGNNVDCKK